MFPKTRRLTGKAVVFVIRRGRALSGPGIRIKWAPASRSVSRATIVTPLAFDKRATRRNRIKRQLREILGPLLTQFNPPVNLVVLVSGQAKGKSFAGLKAELMALLRKGRLLSG
ncbi:ribonuclease P protein component [Candidatus Uhrbacteria bacterium]|nr:ribonuclease P protein component [Candidatus Uhrbacteria bacterium]